MALNAGDKDATAGIAKAIFDAMDKALSPPLVEAGADMKKVRDGWRAVSFAVASGVVAGLIHDAAATPSFAETSSSPAQDPTFWAWVANLAAAFQGWAPTSVEGKDLKTRLKDVIDPAKLPASLKGVIQ
jgi:hypothetical protein